MNTELSLLEAIVLRNVAAVVVRGTESHPSGINGLDTLVSKLEEAIRASRAGTVTEGDNWYCLYYEDGLPVCIELDVSFASLARRLADAASKKDGDAARRSLFGAVEVKFRESLIAG